MKLNIFSIDGSKLGSYTVRVWGKGLRVLTAIISASSRCPRRRASLPTPPSVSLSLSLSISLMPRTRAAYSSFVVSGRKERRQKSDGKRHSRGCASDGKLKTRWPLPVGIAARFLSGQIEMNCDFFCVFFLVFFSCARVSWESCYFFSRSRFECEYKSQTVKRAAQIYAAVIARGWRLVTQLETPARIVTNLRSDARYLWWKCDFMISISTISIDPITISTHVAV